MPVIECAGVRTYYTEAGAGVPVVLLHGGLIAGDSWDVFVPELSETYRVLVPDRRGHGRTPDVEGRYTYGTMADETIAFIEQLVEGPARLVGYSDGGIVALHVALSRPDLVRTIVAIGANFHWNGLQPAFLDDVRQGWDPTAAELAPVHEAYAAQSPDGPDHWPEFVGKVGEMIANGPTLTVEDLGRIECPVLVMAADDDLMTNSHTIELFESLAQGQLAVVPGTSHFLPYEKPDVVATLMQAFLADPSPIRMMPFRFATDTH